MINKPVQKMTEDEADQWQTSGLARLMGKVAWRINPNIFILLAIILTAAIIGSIFKGKIYMGFYFLLIPVILGFARFGAEEKRFQEYKKEKNED